VALRGPSTGLRMMGWVLLAGVPVVLREPQDDTWWVVVGWVGGMLMFVLVKLWGCVWGFCWNYGFTMVGLGP
jgi:hypothetical protein